MTTTLTAVIDCNLLRGQNNREHHRARAERVNDEREATTQALAAGDWRGEPVSLRNQSLGARVTLVRPYSVTPLDSDNLSAAFKAPRDAIAAFLGVDDASDRLHWVYLQSPAPVIGKSLKKGKTRASVDRDTRPMVRIEVMPVEDIDPDKRAIRILRAFATHVAATAQHTAPDSDCLFCLAGRVLAETNDHQEQP